ncbi:hypothetical protein CAPTEDRAFT_182593 [Capitella teleta]|uniref:Dual specificity protein phosphatase n=1 Tax=Capitella teleta TaxID=283909 RepID=R7TQ03_CAPTE|nr:hypothetical protein CAPTEDRAFT_182593 [Capitella teleta]|eukprot:ELT95734.1 hypothetical protein CAPTEDRAFT_182593 [Capitella teleta]
MKMKQDTLAVDTDDSCTACTSNWLGERLLQEHGRGVLILDCRSSVEYHHQHVSGALHITIPSLMLRRLQKGNLTISSVLKCNESKEKFNSQSVSDTIVLYDDSDSAKLSPNSNVVTLLAKKLEKDGCRVRILRDGFKAFFESFPDLCEGVEDPTMSALGGLQSLQISCSPGAETDTTSKPAGRESRSPSNSFVFPVRVLPCLFLGNASNAADIQCLNKNNIRYILNVTQDIPNAFEGRDGFRYMQIPIDDHWSQNLASFFHDAITFIDEARERDCGVLVHCLAGISRSVTVTVAYLMHSRSLSLNDAYDFVKRCKPDISPNFNFMGQLKDFETTLNVTRGCTCAKQSEDEDDSESSSNCVCNKDTKTYFTSPTSTDASCSSLSSSAATTSSSTSAKSATAFDYEVPPTPS